MDPYQSPQSELEEALDDSRLRAWASFPFFRAAISAAGRGCILISGVGFIYFAVFDGTFLGGGAIGGLLMYLLLSFVVSLIVTITYGLLMYFVLLRWLRLPAYSIMFAGFIPGGLVLLPYFLGYGRFEPGAIFLLVYGAVISGLYFYELIKHERKMNSEF